MICPYCAHDGAVRAIGDGMVRCVVCGWQWDLLEEEDAALDEFLLP